MVKKSQKIKGKTLALADFLKEEPSGSPAPTTVREINLNWADEVEANCDNFQSQPKLKVTLPTAPRASRGVEYNDRIPDQPLNSRQIHSEIASNSESERNNRYRSDRPETTSGNWRSDLRNDIVTNSESVRLRMGGRVDYNRYRSDRPEVRAGNWRDKNRSSIKDSQDNRGYSRDSDRRVFGDSNRFERGTDNGRPFVPRRNDRDDFSLGSSRSNAEPRIRQKLILLPRSVATANTAVEKDPPVVIQEANVKITVPTASSIFSGARPVDTRAKEKEIEEKIEKAKTTKGRSPGDLGRSQFNRRESPRRRSPRRRSPNAAGSPNRGLWRASPRSDYSPRRDSPQRFSPRRTSPWSRRDFSPYNSNTASSNNSRISSLERPSSRGRSPSYRARSPPSRDPSLEYNSYSPERRYFPERRRSSPESCNRSPERAYNSYDRRNSSPRRRESPYRNGSPYIRREPPKRNWRAAESRKPSPDLKRSPERSASSRVVPPPRKTDKKRVGAPPSRIVDRPHKTKKERINNVRDNRNRELPKLKKLEAPKFAVSSKYACLEVEDDSD